MIIDFKVNFNNYEEKVLNNYDFVRYICPTCMAKHTLTRHASYERNISFLQKDMLINKKLKMLRLKCSSCDKTHAVLPNDIIPYCIYSYSFVAKVLMNHFLEGKSVLSISTHYNISFQLIYSFILKLNLFLNDCIYVLRILFFLKNVFTPSIKNVLNEIHRLSSNNCFLEEFFKETKWMFLMKKFLNTNTNTIIVGSSKV